MKNVSKDVKVTDCTFCHASTMSDYYPLQESRNFILACESYALTEGHIIVIPQAHIPCVGAFDDTLLNEFLTIDAQIKAFLSATHGTVATFEHGVFGQTVFHAHVHYLPFSGTIADIVPEYQQYTKLQNISELRHRYKRDGGYLYLSINDEMWVVATTLAAPRFFRDRFAKALDAPERGNWRQARQNQRIMETMQAENKNTQALWHKYKHVNV